MLLYISNPLCIELGGEGVLGLWWWWYWWNSPNFHSIHNYCDQYHSYPAELAGKTITLYWTEHERHSVQFSSQGVPHCPLALLHCIVNRKYSGSHCGSLETKCVSFLSCVFWSWPVISPALLVRVVREIALFISLALAVTTAETGWSCNKNPDSQSRYTSWAFLSFSKGLPYVESGSGFSYFFLVGNTRWTGVYASTLSHSCVIQWVIGIAFATQVRSTIFSNYTFDFLVSWHFTEQQNLTVKN